MNKYKITIRDDMFGEFTGEFIAYGLEEAEQIAREHYALELDTFQEDIEIVKHE